MLQQLDRIDTARRTVVRCIIQKRKNKEIR